MAENKIYDIIHFLFAGCPEPIILCLEDDRIGRAIKVGVRNFEFIFSFRRVEQSKTGVLARQYFGEKSGAGGLSGQDEPGAADGTA